MQSILTVSHVGSLLLITLFSFLSVFSHAFAVKIGLCASASLLILVLLVKTKGFVRASYTFFFLLSLGLCLFKGVRVERMVEAMVSNVNFILLFVCVPLLKIPITLGNYLEELLPLVRALPKQQLHPMVVATNFTFSSFLNFGGYRIVHEFFQHVMKNNPLLYGSILSRSFSLGAFWTPYYAAFSIAVSYSQATPGSVIFVGLLLSIIVLGFWSILLFKKAGSEPGEELTERPQFRKLVHLLFFFGLLIASVVVLNQLTDLEVVVIVSLMSSIIAVFWCLFLGQIKEFFQTLGEYGRKELLMVREEAFLFISIGFLAHTFLYMGWKLDLPVLGGLSPWWIFVFILSFSLLVVGLALLGVHHLVSITLINTSLNWQSMGIQPVVYALTILLTWAMCSMLSPFSPANLMTSRITGKTTVQIGVVGNGPFGLFAVVFGAGYLTLINVFLGGW